MKKSVTKFAALTLAATFLSGCNLLTRLSEVGTGPEVSQIENPTLQRDYAPVSMPMPQPEVVRYNPNSLWRNGARAFFKDNRANEVGDILTVMIDVTDSATLNNTTTRTRGDSEDSNVTNLFGYETQLSNIFPNGIDPTALTSLNTDLTTNGTGVITRDETINLNVAAVVTQILPNGHLVITGTQEMRINNELRQLQVTGIVRPEDVSSSNSIEHTKIAELRMTYGGRGNLTELQQPRVGWQIIDILSPF